MGQQGLPACSGYTLHEAMWGAPSLPVPTPSQALTVNEDPDAGRIPEPPTDLGAMFRQDNAARRGVHRRYDDKHGYVYPNVTQADEMVANALPEDFDATETGALEAVLAANSRVRRQGPAAKQPQRTLGGEAIVEAVEYDWTADRRW